MAACEWEFSPSLASTECAFSTRQDKAILRDWQNVFELYGMAPMIPSWQPMVDMTRSIDPRCWSLGTTSIGVGSGDDDGPNIQSTVLGHPVRTRSPSDRRFLRTDPATGWISWLWKPLTPIFVSGVAWRATVSVRQHPWPSSRASLGFLPLSNLIAATNLVVDLKILRKGYCTLLSA